MSKNIYQMRGIRVISATNSTVFEREVDMDVLFNCCEETIVASIHTRGRRGRGRGGLEFMSTNYPKNHPIIARCCNPHTDI